MAFRLTSTMSNALSIALFCLICISCHFCEARQPPHGFAVCEDNFRYTIDEFIYDFNRNYVFGTVEYNQRKEIFNNNMNYIIEHNCQYIMQRKQRHYHYTSSSTSTDTVSGTSTVVAEATTMNSMAQRQALFEKKLLGSEITRPDDNEYHLPKSVSSSLSTSNKLTHFLGINDFIDRLPEELPRGYDSMQSSRVRLSSSSILAENDNDDIYSGFIKTTTDFTATSRRRQLLQDQKSIADGANVRKINSERLLLDALGGRYVDINELPKSVDWRKRGVTTPVKNQGGCGSCWAFASTAVLESHIALQTNILFELSEQEFVSCAPNNLHCGGSGGCAGATAEIAYELVRQHGIVQEWEFGYQEYNGGQFVNCSLTTKSSSPFVRRNYIRGVEEDSSKKLYRGAVATILDYAVLPPNNYTALMNVVAKLGPVAVSVACLPWQFYQSGVFYQPLVPGKATDIDHLVVLEGYGTDQETGEDYWIVRNSWGPLWGENGYIRLKRVGDNECSMDNTPADGTACTIDEHGNTITPAPQRICGNSGILFDSVIPLGGTLV